MNGTALRATRLTPPGRGAVATIELAGPGASGVIDALFTPATPGPLAESPLNRIRLGHWNGPAGEELVVVQVASDRFEIHPHGGDAATAVVLASLEQAGASVETPRNWLAEQGLDLWAREATDTLLQATTLRTARLLVAQRQGVLRRVCEQIEVDLNAGRIATARGQLDRLAKRVPLGKHLVEPFRVVLAGPANVGKSSLLNALLGYSRVIVWELPGTTRDVVTARTAWEGWPIELVDTAGRRTTDDSLEQAGIERGQVAWSTADILVWVVDGSIPWSSEEADRLAEVPDALVVINKGDRWLPDAERPSGPVVSALTGTGLADLQRALMARLVPDPPSDEEPLPFTERHARLIASLAARIDQAERADAK